MQCPTCYTEYEPEDGACPTCHPRKTDSIYRHLIIIALVVIGMIAWWNASQRDAPPHQSRGETSAANVDLSPGAICKVQFSDVKNIPVAVSSAALDDLGDYMAAKDTDGINAMLANGRALLIPAGTQARVIESAGWYGIRARLLSGEYKGEEVYLCRDYLARGD